MDLAPFLSQQENTYLALTLDVGAFVVVILPNIIH